MREQFIIPLNHGQETIVSKEDYDELARALFGEFASPNLGRKREV